MAYKDKRNQKISSKKHYASNRTEIIKRAKLFKPLSIQRNKKFVTAYLINHPCVDCSESDIIVLEFDHIKGIKKFDISFGVRHGYSLKTLREEIDKCEVRCANCHRRKTYYRRKDKKSECKIIEPKKVSQLIIEM